MRPAEILQQIHTGQDGTVIFHGEGFRELGAIPASHLVEHWNSIVHAAAGECYFSLSSGWGGYPRNNLATGLWCGRKTDDLRWLNGLFIDIGAHSLHDARKYDMEAADALLKAGLGVVSSKGLPSPNWVVDSGRGWWLLWLFSEPLRAWSEKVELWRRAAKKMLDVFQSEGFEFVDQSCADPCRLMRVPNSRNPKSGSRVQFKQLNPERHSFLALAQMLGAEAQKTALPGDKKTINANRARCRVGRWKRTLRGLEKLIAIRGEFAKGMRSKFPERHSFPPVDTVARKSQ